MDKIYTVKQIAKKLQVSELTIRRYIKAGKLSASKVGKDFRMLESDLLKLLDKFKVNK